LKPAAIVTDAAAPSGTWWRPRGRCWRARIAQFVPAHPNCRSAEYSGAAAGPIRRCFEGAAWVLYPPRENKNRDVEAIAALWTASARASRA